jgi:hypothetical protein
VVVLTPGDYVNFVDQQRTGAVLVEVEGRTDLTVVHVPEDWCSLIAVLIAS